MDEANVQSRITSIRIKLEEYLSASANSSPVSGSANTLNVLLSQLETLNVNRSILKVTQIGVAVNHLKKKAESTSIRDRAAKLIYKWKEQIKENRENSSMSSSTANTTPHRAVTNPNSEESDGLSINNTSSKRKLANSEESGDAAYVVKHHRVSGAVLSHPENAAISPEVVPPSNQLTFDSGNSSLLLPSHVIMGSNSGDSGKLITNNGSSGISSNSRPNGSHNSKLVETGEAAPQRPAEVLLYEGPWTGDPTRDKARQFMYTAFVGGLQVGNLDNNFASHLISALEEQLFRQLGGKGREYTQQVKSIKWNLSDKENPDFNRHIYEGYITIAELPFMESSAMASDAKKRERMRQQKEGLEACQSDWDLRNLEIKDGQFQCKRCNGKKTVYQQIQIRSADEPMTTFVTCITCSNRWKF